MKKNAEIESGQVIAPWTYNDTPVTEAPDKVMGFIYLLTHIPTGKQYIGKKLFWFSGFHQVKGKRKRIKKESDWRTYFSSSEEIKAMVKEKGPQAWKREILYFAKTKGALNYLEAREQMDRRVLEHPDKYLNGQIQVRVHWTHVKTLIQATESADGADRTDFEPPDRQHEASHADDRDAGTPRAK